VAALTVSGCRTTAQYPTDRRRVALKFFGSTTSDAETVSVARLQSPADVAESFASVAQRIQPQLPDPSLPLTSAGYAASDNMSTNPLTNAPTAPSTTPRAPLDRNSPALRGLSSIARNRMINRMTALPVATAGATTNATAGVSTSGPADRQLGGLSAILRNRIEGSVGAGEEAQFTYPDIHSDPAKNYRNRYGLEGDNDRFVFPWLVNVIFEDRWLLAESDPAAALKNQLRRRTKIDIRDPDPDTANFPNGAYTLPKGRIYVETSPVGFYGASKSTPRVYQWEYLLRYGLTDNLEFRIFSNGFTAQARQGKQPATTGYSPLAFDFKANFWEENTKYFIPAMGMEVYLQTTFGSPVLNGGTQPSISLLFDQSLPLGIGFEWNVGINGAQTGTGQTVYQFAFQWSFQREVVKDFDVFVHGFYNEASLPRVLNFQTVAANSAVPNINVVGAGAIWTVNDRLAIFGSYNFGTTQGSPRTIALSGFALAF
jgi:hypothetical protein